MAGLMTVPPLPNGMARAIERRSAREPEMRMHGVHAHAKMSHGDKSRERRRAARAINTETLGRMPGSGAALCSARTNARFLREVVAYPSLVDFVCSWAERSFSAMTRSGSEGLVAST